MDVELRQIQDSRSGSHSFGAGTNQKVQTSADGVMALAPVSVVTKQEQQEMINRCS